MKNEKLHLFQDQVSNHEEEYGRFYIQITRQRLSPATISYLFANYRR